MKLKIGKIGFFDIIKFLKLPKVREKAIQAAPIKEIRSDYKINRNAKLLHPDYQILIVSEIIDHPGADAKTFVFNREGNGPFAYFRAGQYISIRFDIDGSIVSRPYSISSSPKWALEGKLAVTIKRKPGGYVSCWALDNLKVGDKLTASAPYGNFYYDELRDRKNVLAVAGGSGITPFLSMAYAIRDGIEDFNLTIVYGSTKESAILFKSELDEICAQTDKVKVHHVLSDDPDNENEAYDKGFITAELIVKYASAPCSFFVCGNENLYRFIKGEIAKFNLPARYSRYELMGVTGNVYSMPDYPEECKDQTYTVNVKQGSETYEIKALSSETLLTAFERAGIKAPSMCRSGECGFCRSKLVAGYAYIPEETDYRRYSDIETLNIHPCATFPLSDMTVEIPGTYF